MHRILTSDRASAVALLNYILDFLFLLTLILPFCLSPRFGFFLISLHRVCLRTGVCRWLLSDARNNEAFPFCANYFWVFRLLILVIFSFFAPFLYFASDSPKGMKNYRSLPLSRLVSLSTDGATRRVQSFDVLADERKVLPGTAS